MGLEKPGRLPKAICFRAVLYRGSFYDGAGQLGFDRADHGHRIYAGKRGAGHYAGALASARCARLHSDRFHDVQNVL